MEELNKFYAGKGFPLKKILANKPKDIDDDVVLHAAKELFEEIKGGRQVRDIQIPRIVWNKAKKEIPPEKLWAKLRADQTELINKLNDKLKAAEKELRTLVSQSNILTAERDRLIAEKTELKRQYKRDICLCSIVMIIFMIISGWAWLW